MPHHLSQFGEQRKRVQQRQWGAHEAGQEQSFSVIGLSIKASVHENRDETSSPDLLLSMHRFDMLFNIIIGEEGSVTNIADFIFDF